MGAYYRNAFSGLLATDRCPTSSELFVWADVTERTRETGLALLRGLRPSCNTSAYSRSAAPADHDRIFHPVTHGGPCRLDAARAEAEMLSRAGGDFSNVARALEQELAIAQQTLQCCGPRLCAAASAACRRPPAPEACTLTDRLPTCLVHRPASGAPTQVVLGGALRTASTFAELLLLEHANGLPASQVGWGRITREQMARVFRLHTSAFDIEQRTPYVAALQGSPLLERILRALADEDDGTPGSAPPGASFVAYIGHDTNIANVAAMLGLTWQQPGYQKDQTPPAGALVFELRQTEAGARYVEVTYVAQSLDDMRAVRGDRAMRVRVPVRDCGDEGSACSLAAFAKLVGERLDRSCAL
jgi:4-phytase/acid phosphatase